jgi:hypothetical protein
VWRTDLTRWVRGNASSSVGAGHARTRRLFLIAEVAGSTAFLIFGAIFIRAFLTTAAADPGFDAPHLAVMTVAPAEFGYTPERTATALRALTEDMRRIPGVMAVATADQAPFFVGLSASMTINTEHLDCRTTTCPSIPAYAVDAHFVDAMGMRLRAGRALDPTRADDRDAVVISWRTSRPRDAPSAVRTPKSRRRSTDCASRIAATLKQAMRRTMPTAPSATAATGRRERASGWPSMIGTNCALSVDTGSAVTEAMTAGSSCAMAAAEAPAAGRAITVSHGRSLADIGTAIARAASSGAHSWGSNTPPGP